VIRPEGADVYIDASWYKKGTTHKLAFVHSNGGWINSGKTIADIDKAIEAEELRKLKAFEDRQCELELSTGNT
jgi:hypothetical protein